MKKLIILRPEPAASMTAAYARKIGLDPVKVTLFEMQPIEWTAPDPADFDGILLTSSNSIRYAGNELEKLKGLPVYAVGPVTAKAAKDAGFKIAAVGQRGVNHFLKAIKHDLRLIHLCGEDRLEYRLVWQKMTPVIVYRSSEVDKVDTSPIKDAVALVHSPRAGERLAELVKDKDKSTVTVAAISKQTAEACRKGWDRVAYVDRPQDPALLALAAKLCDNPVEA